MTDAFARLFAQMMASGQEMARAINPALEHLDMRSLEKLLPTIPVDLMELWFGTPFNREGLDAKPRLLLTIGAITVQGALAEPLLRMTIRQALAAGATKREIAETIFQMSMFGGLPAMQKALEVAQSVYAEEDEE